MPEPATRSFTVPDTSTSPGAADAAIVWDANVAQLSDKLEAVHTKPFDAATKTITIGVLKWTTSAPKALQVARYLQGGHGESGRAARERIEAYLDELRTTQRYSIYRALKHPLYPILRKIERIGERYEPVKAATRGGRVVYASNHRSHTDYLVEPLVLDDNGIRPPIIAAGINLFGGPLGLFRRHTHSVRSARRDEQANIRRGWGWVGHFASSS